jgi:DNA modification methylase
VTPYYSDDLVTIYHGDCREILPKLDRVDAVVADPPYNYGKVYGTGAHDDALTRPEYEVWCAEWFAYSRIVANRVVVFPGSGNLDIWFEIAKPSAVGAWYKPGNSAGSIIGWNEWEPWLYWFDGKGLLGGSDVLTAPVGQQPDTGDHPCPKPVLLMRKLLRKLRADSVVDPFLGSGTTLVAAKDLGIRAVGIEIEERYCERAALRCSQEVLGLSA